MSDSFELLTLARQLRGISRVAQALSDRGQKAKQVAVIARKIESIAEELAQISRAKDRPRPAAHE